LIADKKEEEALGTPANIVIEYKNESFLLPNGKDQILLFCSSDGYPFKLEGVIYLILRAYENLTQTKQHQWIRGNLSPDNLACELIIISLYEKSGEYRIMPASQMMYDQYKKEGYFSDCAYKYVCSFKFDEGSNNYEMKLTLNDGLKKATKSMDEWKNICDKAYQIAINENDKLILMNNSVPCRECLVRPTCLDIKSDLAYVKETCYALIDYKKNEIERLKGILPDWAMPFVFDNY